MFRHLSHWISPQSPTVGAQNAEQVIWLGADIHDARRPRRRHDPARPCRLAFTLRHPEDHDPVVGLALFGLALDDEPFVQWSIIHAISLVRWQLCRLESPVGGGSA
jgi:hypothetical protein